MRFLLFCLLVAVVVVSSQYLPAEPVQPAESAKVEPQRRRYNAALHITMDIDKIEKAGINRFDVAEAFNAFLDSRSEFKLSELAELKVQSGGKGVPLRELAVIDVELEMPSVKGKK